MPLGAGGNNPNNSSVPPEIFELLSPETQELTQSGGSTNNLRNFIFWNISEKLLVRAGGGIKKIAARKRPLFPEEDETEPLQPYNSTPPSQAKQGPKL